MKDRHAEPAGTSRTEDRGPLMGFMTTRLMISERQPVFASQNGGTPGQLLDAEIQRLREEFAEQQRQAPDLSHRPPEIHSVTFEFPIGD